MWILLCVFFFSIGISHAQETPYKLLKKTQTAYQHKKYDTTLQLGILALNRTFEELLNKAYHALPFTSKALSSNITYSIDIYNDHSHFNGEMNYTFRYADFLITNTLIYAYEESRYYLTLINGIQYFDTPHDELEIHYLTDELGYYLWNTQEQKVYYAYDFSQYNPEPIIEIIPGLLLTIEFEWTNQSPPHSIILDIIQKTPWKKLQKLFIGD